jgi:hypothetical protein
MTMPVRTDSAAAYLDPPELDDAFTPPAPSPDRVVEERVDDGWNSRSSKLSIAPGRTIVRGTPEGPRVLGHRDPCVDCARNGKPDVRSHQMHIRASRVGREWRGPEAEWFLAVLQDGLVNGTRQADEWQEREQLRKATLGLVPSPTCRNCGRDLRLEDGTYAEWCKDGCRVRNGLSELFAKSTSDVAKIWDREFRGGQEGVIGRELELRRQDTADLKTALEPVSELAAAIKELLANNAKEK